MKITPFVTKTIKPFSFNANRKDINKYPETNTNFQTETGEYKKQKLNTNKLEASKDTFTLQSNTTKDTTPKNDYSNLLYSRIFLY